MNLLSKYQPCERILLHITTKRGRIFGINVTRFRWLILVHVGAITLIGIDPVTTTSCGRSYALNW
jgi:hypothetical protein